MIELLIVGGVLVVLFGFRKIVVSCKPKSKKYIKKYNSPFLNSENPNSKDRGRDSKDECIICFELFNTGVEITQLDCGHIFHTDCINEWNHQSPSCPICRESRPRFD